MTFWQENYTFIKDVYDTRAGNLAKLMEKTDAAINDVIADKIYTSTEFKKVKETFTVGHKSPTLSRFIYTFTGSQKDNRPCVLWAKAAGSLY